MRCSAAGVLARMADESMPLATLAQILEMPPHGLKNFLAADPLFSFEIVRHPTYRKGVVKVMLNQSQKIMVPEQPKLLSAKASSSRVKVTGGNDAQRI